MDDAGCRTPVLVGVLQGGPEHHRPVAYGAGVGAATTEVKVWLPSHAGLDVGTWTGFDGGTPTANGVQQWVADYFDAFSIRSCAWRVSIAGCG